MPEMTLAQLKEAVGKLSAEEIKELRSALPRAQSPARHVRSLLRGGADNEQFLEAVEKATVELADKYGIAETTGASRGRAGGRKRRR